jgi:hypothetical protein
MARRLLDRQLSLLRHLTSGATIFGGQVGHVDPSLAGIDPRLLYLEARFSHEKRMEKIAAVFPRTFNLIRGDGTQVSRAFSQAFPPTCIGRLENARQFYKFLLVSWGSVPAKPRYLPDLAACELALAEMRFCSIVRNEDARAVNRRNFSVSSGMIRRSRNVLLRRCRYDVRGAFETSVTRSAPQKRTTRIAISIPIGACEPTVFELEATIFDLLSALDEWTDGRVIGDTQRANEFAYQLCTRGLLEIRL